MKNTRFAALAALGLVISAPAWALKSYSFSGRVSQIGPDSVVVESGGESREFSKGSLQLSQSGQSASTDSPRIGDQVTVWYILNAQEVRVDRRSQPGEIRPGQQPGQQPRQQQRSSGGVEEPIPQIQDDRAFYSAKNEKSPLKKPSPQG